MGVCRFSRLVYSSIDSTSRSNRFLSADRNDETTLNTASLKPPMFRMSYGALPLSYAPVFLNESWGGGTRTHDIRLLKHVLRIGSRSCALSISFSSWQPFAFVSKGNGRCLGRAGQVVAVVCRKRSGFPWVASRKRTASKRRRLCAVRRLHAAGSEVRTGSSIGCEMPEQLHR